MTRIVQWYQEGNDDITSDLYGMGLLLLYSKSFLNKTRICLSKEQHAQIASFISARSLKAFSFKDTSTVSLLNAAESVLKSMSLPGIIIERNQSTSIGIEFGLRITLANAQGSLVLKMFDTRHCSQRGFHNLPYYQWLNEVIEGMGSHLLIYEVSQGNEGTWREKLQTDIQTWYQNQLQKAGIVDNEALNKIKKEKRLQREATEKASAEKEAQRELQKQKEKEERKKQREDDALHRQRELEKQQQKKLKEKELEQMRLQKAALKKEKTLEQTRLQEEIAKKKCPANLLNHLTYRLLPHPVMS